MDATGGRFPGRLDPAIHVEEVDLGRELVHVGGERLTKKRAEAVADAARARPDMKMGVSRSLLGDNWHYPVHGLRHTPVGDTSGWYCWTGELSDADDFFVPVHPRHVLMRLPALTQYLDLPPGSRFLVAPRARGPLGRPGAARRLTAQQM